ncbi:MAG TPA: helix-turn-helix transcriptional regulator [Thermotogota bacterium]|nr:helix-turn-helix transcriptional regulator [Thermotogota bacterium]
MELLTIGIGVVIMLIVMPDIFERLMELVRNKTQKEITEAIGISAGTLSRYLSRQRTPTIEIIVKFAKFFNVSSDYLLGLTDNPEPKGNIPKEFIPSDYARLKAIESELEKIDLARIIEIERLMRKL